MGKDSEFTSTTSTNDEIKQLFERSGCKTLCRVVQRVKENSSKELFMMECLSNHLLCDPGYETVIFPNGKQIVMFSARLTETQQPSFVDMEQILHKLSMLDSSECYSRGLCFKFETSKDCALIHSYFIKIFDAFKITNFLKFSPPNDGLLFYIIEYINQSQNLSQTDIRPSMEEVLVSVLQNYKPEPVNNSSWSAYKGYVINHEFCFVKLGLEISCINGKIFYPDYTKPIPGSALAKATSGVSDKLPESAPKDSKSWFFVAPKLITDSFSIDLSQVEFFFRSTKAPATLHFMSRTKDTEVFQTEEIPLCVIHKIIDFFVARKEKEQSAKNNLMAGF